MLASSRKMLPLLCCALAVLITVPMLLQAAKYHRARARELTGIPCNDYQWRTRSASQQATARGLLLERGLSSLPRLLEENITFVELLNAAVPRILDSAPVTTEGASLPADSSATPAVAGAVEKLRADLARSISDLGPEQDIRVFQLDRAELTVDHCRVSNVAVQLHRNGAWVLSLRADQNPRLEDDEAERLAYRPRLHLKRNEFHIQMRCYGLYKGVTAPLSLQAGRPILANMHPVDFWVQRMEPRYLRIGCCDRRVAEHFDRIDRMEIEFYYR